MLKANNVQKTQAVPETDSPEAIPAKAYEKPVLVRRAVLQRVTASVQSQG
jgi:hypothetical protein